MMQIGNLKRWSAGAACTITMVGSLPAQVMQPAENQKNVIQIGTGFDHSLLALHLRYARYTNKYRSVALIEFNQSSALLGTENFSSKLGLVHWLPIHKNFSVQGKLLMVHAQSDNRAGKYRAWGYELSVSPMWVFEKGSVGIEVNYNPFFATHIRHSDYWKEYLYEDASDGWYGTTAKTWRLGASVSYYLNQQKSLEASVKGGYQTNGKYDKLVPGLYVNIHLNYRF